MNKRLLTAVAVASIFAGMSAAHAATTTGNFNVTVNVTSKGGAYTVRCTNTLPYTMSLDAVSGTVVGLNYTLALSAASATGNGAGQNYTINGSMVSGQGGTCALGSCSGTDARVLTITY